MCIESSVIVSDIEESEEILYVVLYITCFVILSWW